MILIRFLSAFLFTYTFIIGAAAQDVSVEIIGEREPFQPPSHVISEILNYDSESDITNSIKSWLADEGYLQAETDSISSSDDHLQIYITEGCRYRLHDVDIEIAGNENETEPIPELDIYGAAYKGSAFTADLIEEISAGVLYAFEEEGYYLSEILINEVRKDSESCTISLNASVYAGERLIVHGVRFEGIVRNDPQYLRRVSGIREGERMSPGLLEQGRRNLINSGLFDNVSEGELIFVNDEPIVLYRVEEQQLNYFDGLIGYVPDAAGSGNIAGYGDILLRNSVAEGNLLELRYEQLQPLVSKLNIRAEQQFLGGLPIRAGGMLNFTQQDTSYLVRNLELNSGYRIFTGFEIIGHIRAERSSVAEAGTGTDSPALNSRANFYGLGFNLRNTDRYRVPTRGYTSRVMLERGRRFINDERFDDDNQLSFNQSIFKADVRGFIPLGARQVLAPRVNAMFIESSDYLITDLFRFGGAESIRGFREDQFRASSAVWGEMESRYLLDRYSYIFLFGAYGMYTRPQLINEATDQRAITDNLTSFGFGLAFQSPLGIIKFSYAISPDEDLANGKVHVRITAGL